MSVHSDPAGNGPLGPDDELAPPVPRWVKAFGLAALAIIALFLVMVVSGHGGPHSPLRHFRSHTDGTDTDHASGARRP